ncbi:DUF4373 domain-containing protein [Phocaeicola massiliensis]|uniref:DUF4373 domain-containing protein n=1 Tax=Phocaeicola massiliensis TaxID=204516 RepID=UPI0032ED8552
MGRNKKVGLDYFPMDVDFFQDIHIRKLIKYQGGKAVTIYTLLLCIIYKQGYYMRWDEELPFIISEQTGFEEAYIQEVFKCCLIVGLFSKKLYDSDKVITSSGIQERYKTICGQLRRVCKLDEFVLISSEEKPINSEESTQKKRKEKKNKNITPSPPFKGGGRKNKNEPKEINSKARFLFEEYFKNTFSNSYYWTAKDAGAMSQLLKKLTFSRTQKNMPVDDDSVLYALQILLSSIKEGWIFENFSVANINSKYNEIISNVRNGKKQQVTNIYEQKRIDSERRKSRLMAEFAEADAKFLAEQEAKRKAVGSTGEIPNTIPDGG